MAAPYRLISRLALVTGGGSGIGRAVCQRLAIEGASVVVADVSEESANETLRSLATGAGGAGGQRHVALRVDVSLKESVEGLVTGIQCEYFRPPCVCVSAAGITADDFLLRMEERHFDRVTQVNLKGTFLVIQAISRSLVASGAPKGSIITVGSIVGKVGNVGQGNYTASKAGVEGLTRTTAKELSKFGIRCNCVLPGFISTPMTDKVPHKVIDKITSMVPQGRMGEPAEVADVCAFLASDDSRYITGASIEVTGGLFIG
ncbi:(3R)-3-hydroxyacyl-CoA dehydrogenase [Amia ocellicauda]|uniref:(3R)-3-hydroxyacyl-CoA dehydrogenase n=1 Tax=Amia ocellicauda TaxID=2972642 RepID=UPI00346443C0